MALLEIWIRAPFFEQDGTFLLSYWMRALTGRTGPPSGRPLGKCSGHSRSQTRHLSSWQRRGSLRCASLFSFSKCPVWPPAFPGLWRFYRRKAVAEASADWGWTSVKKVGSYVLFEDWHAFQIKRYFTRPTTAKAQNLFCNLIQGRRCVILYMCVLELSPVMSDSLLTFGL